jgi:dTDP-glucose pyrophosphorylase
MKKDIERIKIKKSTTIVDALRLMDSEGVRLLIIVEGGLFYGLISIGDLQRAIIANKPFTTEVSTIMRTNISVAEYGEDMEHVKQTMVLKKIEIMPVINDKKEITDVLFWHDLFSEAPRSVMYDKIDIPVVIMAGGRGERLKPLTNVIPKPLIPIGDKPIIDEIIGSFQRNGCNNFFISVNYMSDMIKDHFARKGGAEIIEFIEETEPLGTAGSLFYLKGKINTTFFVSNCDILVDQDYSEILNYHRENHNEITIVASLKSLKVPYGLVETEENGRIIRLKEKPYVSYMVNTGLYLLEPHLLSDMEDNRHLDITALIDKVIARNGRAGAFPISEKSWFDIGEIGDYWQIVNPARQKKRGYEI